MDGNCQSLNLKNTPDPELLACRNDLAIDGLSLTVDTCQMQLAHRTGYPQPSLWFLLRQNVLNAILRHPF